MSALSDINTDVGLSEKCWVANKCSCKIWRPYSVRENVIFVINYSFIEKQNDAIALQIT